jgi:hypothetical protein
MNRAIINIDRLVLKGSRREQKNAIVLGLHEELGRVFSDREAVRHLNTVRVVSRLQVGRVHIGHGSRPQHVGGNVARAISRKITK